MAPLLCRAGQCLSQPLVQVLILGSPDCLDMHPLKMAVSLVLGAAYLQHLSLEDCPLELQEVFVLRHPVSCFKDPSAPALVYVDVQSLYRALGV